jgi:hypothetical protein
VLGNKSLRFELAREMNRTAKEWARRAEIFGGSIPVDAILEAAKRLETADADVS